MIAALLLAAAVVPGATATAASSPPAPSSIRARLSPREITVGDRVRVEIELTLPPGERWGPPAVDPGMRQWGDGELLARERPQPLPGPTTRYRLDLLVTAFRTGKVTLPPIAVAVAPLRQEEPSPPQPLVFRTPPLSFDVRSVLPVKGEPTPKPPTPPQPWPVGSAFWWAASGLALASLLAGALLFWKRRGLGAAVPAAPPLPPLDQFLRDLGALTREPSAERVHTGLSLALRHLLAALLGFPAAERTTSEIDRELKRGHHLEASTRRRVVELLRRCDEVKFARRPTTREEVTERLSGARELGRQVEHELVPALAAAGAGESAA